MATKKKVKAITYLGSPQSLPQEPQSQIPNYEGPGVKFQKFFKLNKGNGSYEIREQTENSITVALANNLLGLPAGTYSLNRGNVGKRFVIQYLLVQSLLTTTHLTEITFEDTKGDNGFTLNIPSSANGLMTSISLVPKTFIGETINIILSQAIPINQFLSIAMYGWYEDLN
jgi:hypothetical protein